MPIPHTVYKQGAIATDVYPADLSAWLADGWSLSQEDVPVVSPVAEDAIALPPEPIQSGLVNVNSSTLEELVGLPQIGIAKAKKILENTPYQSLDDLKVVLPGVDWDALGDRLMF